MSRLYTARRLDSLQESTIRSITRYALERGAVMLAQGFPDFNPPTEVMCAAERAIRAGINQYGMTWGDASLRRAIAQTARRFYNTSVDPDEHVTVTCGVSEAIIASLLAIIDPGERVIVLEPAHENYHAGIAFAGGVPVWVPIRPPEHRFDPDELRSAFRAGAKAIIFNSPHNPSGRVFTRSELALIAALCIEFDCVAISDEIYEHILYDGHQHIPISTLPGMWERTITVSGLGKTFAATGWRIGYAIADKRLTDGLRKIHDYTTVCAPAPLQAAMVAGLEMPDSYYNDLLTFYASRRQRLMQILDRNGLSYHVPEGAYYVMADFRELGHGDDDVAFAYWLIEKIGVATVPGSAFYRSDPRLGRGMIRFAFPKKDATLDLAEARFQNLRATPSRDRQFDPGPRPTN